jgi:hypothetical protein
MCTSPLLWSSADVIAWAEEEGIAAAAVTALCDKNCDGATLLGVKECEIQKWGLSKSEIKQLVALVERCQRAYMKSLQDEVTTFQQARVEEKEANMRETELAIAADFAKQEEEKVTAEIKRVEEAASAALAKKTKEAAPEMPSIVPQPRKMPRARVKSPRIKLVSTFKQFAPKTKQMIPFAPKQPKPSSTHYLVRRVRSQKPQESQQVRLLGPAWIRKDGHNAIELTAAAKVVTVTLEVELQNGESRSMTLSPHKSLNTSLSYAGPVIGTIRTRPGRGHGVEVKFHVGNQSNFLISPTDGSERLRVTLIDTIAEVTTVVTMSAWGRMQLGVACRKSTLNEIKRQTGTEQLLEAEGGSEYGRLHGKIVQARASYVESSLLDRAMAKLQTLAINAPDLERLRRCLRWDKQTDATSASTGASWVTALRGGCSVNGCKVGAEREGELLQIEAGAVALALGGCNAAPQDGTPLDKWLFDILSEAAVLALPQGAVWFTKSDSDEPKHAIFSNPNRNQSPAALKNYLHRLSATGVLAAAALDSMIKHTEDKYRKSVTAVQVNLHLDGRSSHKQHHDIYSIAQRESAGRDCTCSFKENVATCCYSVGSSRRMLLKAVPCEHRHSCGEKCDGCWEKPWLHSGDVMYFNNDWNRTWSHGIPSHDYDKDGEVGPRISIALLCAEGSPTCEVSKYAPSSNPYIKL